MAWHIRFYTHICVNSRWTQSLHMRPRMLQVHSDRFSAATASWIQSPALRRTQTLPRPRRANIVGAKDLVPSCILPEENLAGYVLGMIGDTSLRTIGPMFLSMPLMVTNISSMVINKAIRLPSSRSTGMRNPTNDVIVSRVVGRKVLMKYGLALLAKTTTKPLRERVSFEPMTW